MQKESSPTLPFFLLTGKTLDENIADFGGFNLALGMWNAKLKADGLTGEALRHQQRQFFLEYAYLWGTLSTDKTLKLQLEVNEYFACHNRVNGTVHLVDDW